MACSMAIHPSNSNTQKGLLGYLLQGNTRLLVARPLEGLQGRVKYRSRAVARLLKVTSAHSSPVFRSCDVWNLVTPWV